VVELAYFPDNLPFVHNYMADVVLPKRFVVDVKGSLVHRRLMGCVLGPMPLELASSSDMKGLVLGLLESQAITDLNGRNIGSSVTDFSLVAGLADPTYRIKFGGFEISVGVKVHPPSDLVVSITAWNHPTVVDGGLRPIINQREVGLVELYDRYAKRWLEVAGRRFGSRWTDEIEWVGIVDPRQPPSDRFERRPPEIAPRYRVRLLDGEWIWTVQVDPVSNKGMEYLFG